MQPEWVSPRAGSTHISNGQGFPTDLMIDIPMLPSGILDFYKQKLCPLLCSQQTIWYMFATYIPWVQVCTFKLNRTWCNAMSHPCGHCESPWHLGHDYAITWPNYGNRALCNPVSHASFFISFFSIFFFLRSSLWHCAITWPNYGNRAWCNPRSHSWGNTFSDLNKEKENKKTKQWKL